VNPLLPALGMALFLTILAEYLVMLLMIHINWRILLLYTILINCFTNPLLNYIYLFISPSIWPLEVGVVLVEAPLIHLLTRVSWRYALVCSLCANIVSFLTGKFLMHYALTLS
jgi:hypothetical protein